jgi:hypothetical protein
MGREMGAVAGLFIAGKMAAQGRIVECECFLLTLAGAMP